MSDSGAKGIKKPKIVRLYGRRLVREQNRNAYLQRDDCSAPLSFNYMADWEPVEGKDE